MKPQKFISKRLLALSTAVLFSLGFGVANATEPCGDFGECKVLIEINATDGDIGFHFLMDGDDLIRAALFNPHHRQIFKYRTRRELRHQFLTETFAESAEPLCFDPTTDDDPDNDDEDFVTLAEFLERWSEGSYHFLGIGEKWEISLGHTELMFDLPAAPTDLAYDEGEISWMSGEDLGECSEGLEQLVVDGVLPNPAGVPVAAWEVVFESDDYLISLNADNVALQDILQEIAKQTNLRLVQHVVLDRMITLVVVKQPPPEVLATILRNDSYQLFQRVANDCRRACVKTKCEQHDRCKTKLDCKQRRQGSAYHRGETVDSPGPWNEIGGAVRDPSQPDRKRHAHAERERRDQNNRKYYLDTVGESHQLLEEHWQQSYIQNSEDRYTGDHDTHRRYFILLEALHQTIRIRAAKSGEYQEAAEHHGNGVQRVTEEQDKLLNEGHLNEEERKTEQEEITARASDCAGRPAAFGQGQRQQYQKNTGNRGLSDRGD